VTRYGLSICQLVFQLIDGCRKNGDLTHICGLFDESGGIAQSNERDWIGILNRQEVTTTGKASVGYFQGDKSGVARGNNVDAEKWINFLALQLKYLNNHQQYRRQNLQHHPANLQCNLA